MWKYLICLIVLQIFGTGTILSDIEHTVARGESIESIAEKYGITTDKLLEANNDASSLFYIGQKLKIPTTQNNLNSHSEFSQAKIMSSMPSSVEQGLAEEAKTHFKNKEWGKAVKTYSKLIKDYPKSIYYYNRALSYYHNNKNRQAANDFEKALSMDDCTLSMLENGPKLLEDARRRHSEWSAKRTEMIGSLILGVAAVGLGTWAAAESSNIESSGNNYTNNNTSSYTSNNNTDYEPDRHEATSNSSKKKQKCGFCGGKGSTIEYTASFDNPDKWCEDCGKKVVSGHYHKTCTHCNGTGER